ncbi:MAG: dihydrolipoamide acetyltransferase family protein [Bacillota bacterium]
MIEVKLHDIGEGMTQADVLALFVQPGDRVNPDEPLVEVQTDKMTAEIPAPYAGVIKEVKVEVGQTISVGTTIFLLERVDHESEAEVASTVETPLITETTNHAAVTAVHAGASEKEKSKGRRTMASPYTRKLARENGVDIEMVTGSGPSGRITDKDVFNFGKVTRNPQEMPLKSTPQKTEEKNQTEAKSKTIPFKGRRKQIATKMSQSLLTIPHCTHFEEVDVTNILEMREFWKKRNVSVSATALFVKAISISLRDYPIFNACLNEEKALIELHEEHHIGVAIDTEEGLIVPVVRNVEKKSLLAIHNELKELTVKAQENRLTIGEMTGSTFTISNVGPLGGSIGATPIINQPEVGLISFHKTKKRPVVNEQDEIVIRSMMNISMSFDHRVADGATAVAFTNRLTELLEEPKLLLLELV